MKFTDIVATFLRDGLCPKRLGSRKTLTYAVSIFRLPNRLAEWHIVVKPGLCENALFKWIFPCTAVFSTLFNWIK